jgi:hypothetical protein
MWACMDAFASPKRDPGVVYNDSGHCVRFPLQDRGTARSEKVPKIAFGYLGNLIDFLTAQKHCIFSDDCDT